MRRRSAAARDEGAAVSTLPRTRVAPARSGRPYPRHELVLGRYHLLERIGSGGHGTVWVAQDTERPRRVAVKRVPLGGSERERARVVRESHAVARLDHPAIVALLEAGEQDGAHYIVSELVEGSSLAALYRDGGPDDAALLAIGAQIAAALEHAHARGVVHRDVKPQNVLVPARKDAGAKLADFGVARVDGEHALTSAGEVIGTFEYMAPEQAQGRPAGPPADLYALALTLYEGLAGTNPLRGRTLAATVMRVGGPIAPLRGERPDLPVALCAAIDRALAPEPSRRGTLAQLRDALEAAPSPRGARVALAAPVLTPRARNLLGALAAGVAGGALTTMLAGAHDAGQSALAGAACAVLVGLGGGAGWLVMALAVLGWLGVAGRSGEALILAAALAPVPALLPARPWLWSTPVIAPLLGLLGLAACAPALAGRLARRALPRATLGALFYWWVACAETLSGRRLLFGAPPLVRPSGSWSASPGAAFAHALAPLCSDGRLLTAGAWALAAAALPWALRGGSVQLRALGALIWAGVLMLALALISGHLGAAHSPMGIAVAAVAAALAFGGAGAADPPHRRADVA
jgi:eukaryotic-like serine/threonine-protein kinase